MDVHVSNLHLLPPQANAAKHRSADGLYEPRLYVIQREPTGDFPGLDYVVALDLAVACQEWLAAEPTYVGPVGPDLPKHWWPDTGGLIIIDPTEPDGIIDDPDRLRPYLRLDEDGDDTSDTDGDDVSEDGDENNSSNNSSN